MNGDKMQSRGYPLRVTEENDGSWTVEAPDLPGMVAAGRSVAAAMRLVPEAIDAWVERAQEEGIRVPQPSRDEEEYSGKFMVRLSRSLHRRLAEHARAETVSLNAYCTMLLTQGVERRAGEQIDARSLRVFLEDAAEQLWGHGAILGSYAFRRLRYTDPVLTTRANVAESPQLYQYVVKSSLLDATSQLLLEGRGGAAITTGGQAASGSRVLREEEHRGTMVPSG